MKSSRRGENDRPSGIFKRLKRNGEGLSSDQLKRKAEAETAANRIRANRVSLLRPFFELTTNQYRLAWRMRKPLVSGAGKDKGDPSFHDILRGGTGNPAEGKSTLAQGETQNVLTPLFSAVLTHEALLPLWDGVFDDRARRLSEETENRILSGDNYFPVMQIGWGVHGSIIASELTATVPYLAQRSLGVDAYPSYGGQFRNAYAGGVYDMNTENTGRRNQRDKNYLGPRSPMQLNDVGTQFYEDNALFGRVIGLNGYLSGMPPLFLYTVMSVRENPSYRSGAKRSQKRGRYQLELKSKYSDRVLSVYTDVLSIASGIGEPLFNFERDSETQAVLEKRARDMKRGKLPQVMSAEQFNATMNDPRDPFSRKQLDGKKILFLGSGTSSITGMETALCMNESIAGAYVTRLGGPAALSWWTGKELMDREAILKQLWGRYFPIVDAMGDASTIQGPSIVTRKGYGRRLRQVGKMIQVIADDGSSELADIVVAGTGYDTSSLETVLQGVLGGKTLDEQAMDIPHPRDKKYLAGKKLRGHNIFLSGPAALTSRNDYTRTIYPVAQAVASFSDGSVAMAQEIIEAVKRTAPDALLQPQDKEVSAPVRRRSSVENELLKKSPAQEHVFSYQKSEKSVRSQWNESMPLEEFTTLMLATALDGKKFFLPPGSRFFVEVQEVNRPSDYRAHHKLPGTYKRAYRVRVRAINMDTLTPVSVSGKDAAEIASALEDVSVAKCIYQYLLGEHNKPSITLQLGVGNGSEIRQGGIEIQG